MEEKWYKRDIETGRGCRKWKRGRNIDTDRDGKRNRRDGKSERKRSNRQTERANIKHRSVKSMSRKSSDLIEE